MHLQPCLCGTQSAPKRQMGGCAKVQLSPRSQRPVPAHLPQRCLPPRPMPSFPGCWKWQRSPKEQDPKESQSLHTAHCALVRLLGATDPDWHGGQYAWKRADLGASGASAASDSSVLPLYAWKRVDLGASAPIDFDRHDDPPVVLGGADPADPAAAAAKALLDRHLPPPPPVALAVVAVALAVTPPCKTWRLLVDRARRKP